MGTGAEHAPRTDVVATPGLDLGDPTAVDGAVDGVDHQQPPQVPTAGLMLEVGRAEVPGDGQTGAGRGQGQALHVSHVVVPPDLHPGEPEIEPVRCRPVGSLPEPTVQAGRCGQQVPGDVVADLARGDGPEVELARVWADPSHGCTGL